jgi:hypothetical protein
MKIIGLMVLGAFLAIAFEHCIPSYVPKTTICGDNGNCIHDTDR